MTALAAELVPIPNPTGKALKAAKDRQRMMFNEELTHIRMGNWRGDNGCEVTFLGSLSQLHGTVCACEPPCKPHTDIAVPVAASRPAAAPVPLPPGVSAA